MLRETILGARCEPYAEKQVCSQQFSDARPWQRTTVSTFSQRVQRLFSLRHSLRIAKGLALRSPHAIRPRDRPLSADASLSASRFTMFAPAVRLPRIIRELALGQFSDIYLRGSIFDLIKGRSRVRARASPSRQLRRCASEFAARRCLLCASLRKVVQRFLLFFFRPDVRAAE